MSIHNTYAVFGLGKYGFSVAKELVNNGAEVLAIDMDEEIVNASADELPLCKCADITDPDVIKHLGIADIDVVIVAMARNLEASVMAVTLCKEAGVKTVIAKCASEMHQKILSRVGADRVLVPEIESGTRLGKSLISAGFVDLMEISPDVSVVELKVKKDWVGKNLVTLNLRKKYGINVVAVRTGDKVEININPETPLAKDNTLIVIANTSKLNRI